MMTPQEREVSAAKMAHALALSRLLGCGVDHQLGRGDAAKLAVAAAEYVEASRAYEALAGRLKALPPDRAVMTPQELELTAASARLDFAKARALGQRARRLLGLRDR